MFHFLTCLLPPYLFFSARFLKMCKASIKLYLFWRADPSWLAFYRSWPAGLPNWLGMVNKTGLFPCDQVFSVKWNFSFFKAALPKTKTKLLHLGNQLHILSFLFSHLCIFQNANLYWMLKLRFWNFKLPFFLNAVFIGSNNVVFSFGYLFELIFAY